MSSVFQAGWSFSSLLPAMRRGDRAARSIYPIRQYTLADTSLGSGLAGRYGLVIFRCPAGLSGFSWSSGMSLLCCWDCYLSSDRNKNNKMTSDQTTKRASRSDERWGFRMKKRRFLIVSLCAALLVVGILIITLRPKHQTLYRVTYLPSLGGKFSLPCSINDRGQIAGFSEVANGGYHLFL
jgi:hypothetical protein